MSQPPVIFFDGVCNLCQGAVRFVILRDRAARFRFAPLQSDGHRAQFAVTGRVGEPMDTVILVEDGRRYERSTAALRIARHLDGVWPLLYVFIVIPRPIRDAIYRWIARHRYRWFGRQDQCMIPIPDHQSRFLDSSHG
jgi:predicted DCC family thiol-disulfide oxidoreductase YuxK